MTEEVKFKCPLCGKEWVEEQDTEDDWFGLATTQTLCEECSKELVKKNWSTQTNAKNNALDVR